MRKINEIINNFLMYVGMWAITRFYKRIDVLLSKDRQRVLGITFSNSKKYIDYVSEFKLK